MFNELYTTEDIYKNVKYIKELYENQKKKVEKEKYLENVLLDDYVKVIHHIHNKYDCVSEFFQKAQEEIGNEKKSERKNFEIVKDWISRDFFNGNKIKIKKIISGGYEGYYYAIYLDFCGEEISIEIPIRNRITAKNIHYANYGQFVVFLTTSSCSQSAIFHSYKIEEIAEFLSVWEKGKNNGKIV